MFVNLLSFSTAVVGFTTNIRFFIDTKIVIIFFYVHFDLISSHWANQSTSAWIYVWLNNIIWKKQWLKVLVFSSVDNVFQIHAGYRSGYIRNFSCIIHFIIKIYNFTMCKLRLISQISYRIVILVLVTKLNLLNSNTKSYCSTHLFRNSYACSNQKHYLKDLIICAWSTLGRSRKFWTAR